MTEEELLHDRHQQRLKKCQLSFLRQGSPHMATKNELQDVKLSHSVKYFD